MEAVLKFRIRQIHNTAIHKSHPSPSFGCCENVSILIILPTAPCFNISLITKKSNIILQQIRESLYYIVHDKSNTE